MPNIRAINRKKYQISKNRFMELYYFCLQYPEWQKELIDKRKVLKGVNYSDAPAASGNISDQTANIAIQTAELSQKCNIIEQAAQDADPELYEYLLKAVTDEGITFNYLSTKLNMPCGRDRFYDRRRKFYFLLDKRLKNKDVKE